MCITGCSPKLRFYDDFIDKIQKDESALITLKKDSSFLIKEIKIPLKEILMGTEDKFFKEPEDKTGNQHSWDKRIKETVIKLVKEINFSYNEFIYQGCLIYSKGNVKDVRKWKYLSGTVNSAVYFGKTGLLCENSYSLRPVTHAQINKGENEFPEFIKLLFVFSHNSKIKGYFFSRDDWIHLMSPILSLKYLKQHRNLKYENLIDGVNILYVSSIEDINEELKLKIINYSKVESPLCMLFKSDMLIEKLTEMFEDVNLKDMKGENREMIYCDTLM